ncbi:MAG: hypothetical protein Q8S54_00630 [Bacteroidota bacterium]|nr:hypothetical protein [Odoribacter sp.]MDP3641674.1 hypothetical protein [Bacteroidota bacterium]
MKTFIPLMILVIALLVTLPPGIQVQASNLSDQNSFVVNNQITAPAYLAQEEGGVASKDSATEDPVHELVEGDNFFSDNWGALVLGLLGFVDLVARLTPTEKDNSIVNFLMSIFNALIPNLKKGGGSFKLLSK